MRFAPVTAALGLALVVTASMGQAQQRDPAPRAAMLIAQGDASLASGETQAAIDAYEAALVVDPGYTPLYNLLADAARKDGLQGKAITYYREALARDPGNLAAISGEGAALVEKGAIEKARLNLAKLQSLCGSDCAEASRLAAVIARGPKTPVLAAETILPDAQVTQN